MQGGAHLCHKLVSPQVPLLSCLHCLDMTALASSQLLSMVANVAAAVTPALNLTETVRAAKMVQGTLLNVAVTVHGCVSARVCLPVTLTEAVSAAVSPTEALTKAANAILLAAAWP